MAVSAGMIAKAAATVLSNEKLRKGVGWTLVAILSPIIVLIALLCSIGSGGADHNNQAVAASFYGVSYSTEVPAEFRHHIEEMRTAFSLLDSAVASVNGQTESGNGLDPIRIKAVFYALCFGEDAPSARAANRFVEYDELDSPYKVVNNIVYRLRRTLSVIGLDKLVVGKNGTFQINPDYNIHTDFDRFEDACIQLKTEEKPDMRHSLYHTAINLYKGQLLPRCEHELWLMQLSMYYQSLYIRQSAMGISAQYGARNF